MEPKNYRFSTKVWLSLGTATWYFITVPQKISQEIKNNFGSLAGGWGALPVRVKVGVTQWQTSVFWDNKLGAYILPLKSTVRKQENIKAEQRLKIHIELLI